jgi:hypothetical protein
MSETSYDCKGVHERTNDAAARARCSFIFHPARPSPSTLTLAHARSVVEEEFADHFEVGQTVLAASPAHCT